MAGTECACGGPTLGRNACGAEMGLGSAEARFVPLIRSSPRRSSARPLLHIGSADPFVGSEWEADVPGKAHWMIRLASPSYTGRELRWIADSFEQAQRLRVRTGEQIRAVLHGRDEAWQVELDGTEDASATLAEIRKGGTPGPVPLLGHAYHLHWSLEQKMLRALGECLQAHPVWPWLSQVKGIGPSLAGKLLARLCVEEADTPSAFWAYCGLATVPGTEYQCTTCGLVVGFPVSYHVTGTHQQLGSKRRCTGTLQRARGPEDGARVAQPSPGRGVKSPYDRRAKQVCYLIGTAFLKAGGPYEQFYRRQRAKLETERPGWASIRQHLTCMRKTEKLFLSHLWLVWRKAVCLPTTSPYALNTEAGFISPEQMVGPDTAEREVVVLSLMSRETQTK